MYTKKNQIVKGKDETNTTIKKYFFQKTTSLISLQYKLRSLKFSINPFKRSKRPISP